MGSAEPGLAGRDLREWGVPRTVVRGFRPDRLRELRLAAGRTTDDLAALTSVSRQSISAWETGRSVPSPSALCALAATLGAEIADLVALSTDELRLSDLRVLAGLEQSEVAARVGVSVTTLAELERGVRAPAEDRASVLAEVYGVGPAVVWAAAARSAAARVSRADQR